jgi:diguanylate cyclase (GGDEF)-like protein
VAERISNEIKSEAIATDRGPLKITVSIGVAEASLSMSSAAALLDSADQALYMAKLAGRNCVAQFRRTVRHQDLATAPHSTGHPHQSPTADSR